MTTVYVPENAEVHPDAFGPEVQIVRRRIGSPIDIPYIPENPDWIELLVRL